MHLPRRSKHQQPEIKTETSGQWTCRLPRTQHQVCPGAPGSIREGPHALYGWTSSSGGPSSLQSKPWFMSCFCSLYTWSVRLQPGPTIRHTACIPDFHNHLPLFHGEKPGPGEICCLVRSLSLKGQTWNLNPTFPTLELTLWTTEP